MLSVHTKTKQKMGKYLPTLDPSAARTVATGVTAGLIIYACSFLVYACGSIYKTRREYDFKKSALGLESLKLEYQYATNPAFEENLPRVRVRLMKYRHRVRPDAAGKAAETASKEAVREAMREVMREVMKETMKEVSEKALKAFSSALENVTTTTTTTATASQERSEGAYAILPLPLYTDASGWSSSRAGAAIECSTFDLPAFSH